VQKLSTAITDTILKCGDLTLKLGKTYEAHVPYVQRFMVDRGIAGTTWVKVEKWQVPSEFTTSC